MYLIYIDGLYHCWTRATHVRLRCSTGRHTFGVAYKDAAGVRSPTVTIEGVAG